MSDVQELFDAIAAGDEPRVRELAATHPDSLAQRNQAGIGCILWALYHRQTALAGTLAELRGEPDLFEAVALGNQEAFEARATDPTATTETTPDGFTALHLACFFGHEELARRLLELGANPDVAAGNPSGVYPIHSAAAARSAGIVRALLEHGASPDVQQAGGWTALHAAAKHGDAEMCRALVEGGASVGVRAEDGSGAVELARAEGHGEVVELLGG